MSGPTELWCGIDAGGSNTRVALADAAGAVVAEQRGPGANPTVVGRERSAEVLGATVSAALAVAREDRGEVMVRGVHLGLAGAGSLRTGGATGDPVTAALTTITGVTPVLSGDAACSFAAGTPEPDGAVLLAGTGAGATRIGGYRERWSIDGWGWRLGDLGSGTWIGREAVRRSLTAVEGRSPASALVAVVSDLFGVPGEVRDDQRRHRVALLDHVAEGGPAEWTALVAPVFAAAAAGDAVAAQICAEAGELLAGTLAAVDVLGRGEPIVISGGIVAAPGSPVTRALLPHLSGEQVLVVDVRGGERGALWLALRHDLGASADALHPLLCAPRELHTG